MAEGARQVRVFVSSPGDARFERSRLGAGDRAPQRRIPGRRTAYRDPLGDRILQGARHVPSADSGSGAVRHRRRHFPLTARHRVAARFSAHAKTASLIRAGRLMRCLLPSRQLRASGLPDVYVFRYPQPPTVQLDDPNRAEIEAQWQHLQVFLRDLVPNSGWTVQGRVPDIQFD